MNTEPEVRTDHKLPTPPLKGNLPPAPDDGITNLPSFIGTEITLHGNTAFGTLYHIGNTHLPRHGCDADTLIETGKINSAILRKINELDPTVCFLEGYEESYNVENYKEDYKEDFAKLAKCFPERKIPDFISDEQAILLSTWRIPRAILISFFCPEVKILGSECDSTLIDNLSDRPFIDESTRNFIRMDYRETVALDIIATHFDSIQKSGQRGILIYGARHIFEDTDIPSDRTVETMPLVVKYSMEKIGSFYYAEKIISVSDQDEQIAVLNRATKVESWIWAKLLSSRAQLNAITKLQVSLDFKDSPEQCLADLIHDTKSGPERGAVIEALKVAYDAGTAPFDAFYMRAGCEKELEDISNGIPALAIYNELHAFTQLEFVRRAGPIQSYCFASMLSRKAQMAALDKLVLDPNHSVEQARNRLLSAAIDDKVRSEIMRRFESTEKPFSHRSEVPAPTS